MQNAIHFVRFESQPDEHYWNAVKVFGPPDFLHRFWDHRAQGDIIDGDVVVFGKGDGSQPINEYSYDDSAHQ